MPTVGDRAWRRKRKGRMKKTVVELIAIVKWTLTFSKVQLKSCFLVLEGSSQGASFLSNKIEL